jgi:two-component system nitrogen regulation sensor histidine kinase NtrY
VEVLKNLVNEFSRYARMPVTSPTLNDLNSVVADSVLLFQNAHKDIVIEFRPAEGLPKLNIDTEQISRVMVNLLDNAVTAVKKDGRISISVSYEEAQRLASVIVADNGTGVSSSDKRKMFEPYFSTKKSGTGLGLAIVRSVIFDHHGQVSVADNKPSGTIVSFQLPVPET